jgi:peptidoglycan/xylan/chitin deacetylase (PgdA/CDA1 family)
MICLTGDIHHSSLKTNEQRYIDADDSEVKISYRYLELVEKYKLKVTFYATGKTLKEEWEDFKPITKSKFVEIGGHTYSGIPLNTFEKLKYKLSGINPPSHSLTYGSKFCQKRDIKKMIDIVRKRTGEDIISWRSHGYVHDDKTYPILYKQGIKLVSDEISKTKLFPEIINEGLISHPINVIPDHDHIYHAHRDEEFCRKAKERGYGADNFSCDSYPIEEWGELVERQVINIEKRNGIATVLMHPLCQYLSDEFKTAEKLFRVFTKYKTIWAKEIIDYMN